MTYDANAFARKMTQYIMRHNGNIIVDITTGTMRGIGWVTTDVARVAARPGIILINTYSYRQKHQGDIQASVNNLIKSLTTHA